MKEEKKVAQIECPICGVRGIQEYIEPPAKLEDCFNKGTKWHDCIINNPGESQKMK